MDFCKELGYEDMIKLLDDLSSRSETVKTSYIGNSIMSRPIPLITLGDKNAQKSVLYVSTHHAAENVCTSAIMAFVEEYAGAYKKGGKIFGIDIFSLYKMRKIFVVPMLNPDGVEYRLNGVDESNPIKERVISYNGGDDFSDWNANARGVDLNHNYDAYFNEYKEIEKREGITAGKSKFSGESAESEPECAALANFIRYNSDDIEGIITLHTQGEEIYYKSMGKDPEKSAHIAKVVSRMTGYCLSEAEGTASYGGLTDWFIKEFNKPSFTIECGKGKNPLPPSQILDIYSSMREILFTFPILF